MPWHCTSLHQSKHSLISSHLISSLRHHSAPLQAVILCTCFFTQCLQPLEINPRVSDPPTTHGLIEGPLPHAMALHIAAPKQEQSHLISSHLIGTIPSKLSSSAHASSPNVCNLRKLIQGSLTSRPPMDYLSTHLPMRWVQRPLD